jgi:hypothetical protein
MKTANMTIVALAGALLVSWTFEAAAAVMESSATSRDAAISRCLAQAHRQYPEKCWDWGQAPGFRLSHLHF